MDVPALVDADCGSVPSWKVWWCWTRKGSGVGLGKGTGRFKW
jgi:hypothetical protein